MASSQPPFSSPSPSIPFTGPNSTEPSNSPSASTSSVPNGGPTPSSSAGPSFFQPNGINGNGNGSTNGNVNGNGFAPQIGSYNSYQPNSHQPPQQFNHGPSHQQQQQQQHQSHQPYFTRNNNNFRGQNQHHHANHHAHSQHHQHQHQQHQHQHVPAPQSQYQHQPDLHQSHPQHQHQQQQQHHPNVQHQHNGPQFQPRYPDQGMPQAYNGWTGGGNQYYPSPNQPYPQMGGPGPATMQNGYAYGGDQFGRQGFPGAMYGGGSGQGIYDGRMGPEGEVQIPPVEGDQSQQTYTNGPQLPVSEYPYPPPLPSSSNPSPHPHSASIPPGPPNGAGPYPPYFPANHPYNYGGGIGIGAGYPPYPPSQGYGGYGFGDGFMPPPIPNGVSIPPMNNGVGSLPISQSNGPSRSLNPAAQGFKFVPSNQPPPPASAPPLPIAAPPPSGTMSTSNTIGHIGDAPVPVFASIRRSSTPKAVAQTAGNQPKFSQPVVVDGEKLKGIGGNRRDSEGEYVDPVPVPTLAGGDTLGLSEAQPSKSMDLPQPSPLVLGGQANLAATSQSDLTSPTRATETSPAAAPAPSSAPSAAPEESSSPAAPPSPAVLTISDDQSSKWQFVGPAISGFMSPPSSSNPPSLSQALASASAHRTKPSSSKSTPPGGQTKKIKPIMDGPVIYTSTRPLAAEKGDNAYKSTATLRAVGEGIKGKGKESAQRRRAVLAVGEGTKAGKGGRRQFGGDRMTFGDIGEEAEPEQEAPEAPKPTEEVSSAPNPKAAEAKSAPEASVTSASTEIPSAPIPGPSETTTPIVPSPTPPPSAPKPKLPPTSWAALVSSKPSTSAPSPASTSATPTASAGPSKLPSPIRSTAPLPSTPETISGETLPSQPKIAVTPSSAPAGAAGKRPSFNYAAAAAAGAALSPADELVKLLSEGLGYRGAAPGVSKGTIPRGLINTGNMCFINTILQVLAYCPPFTDLLETLGQRLKADLGRKTPLLEAVIVFLRELQPSLNSSSPALSVANGTIPPRGMARAVTAPTSFQQGRGVGGKDAFVPENVYDAMKENKRFDSMRRGFQEDAEEYLGFFLNTLHEELLFLLSRTHTRSTVQPNGTSSHANSDNREQSIERPISPSAQDSSSASWLEVGKKQRTHVVRSNESRESAITRIFGGTLRSILHTPGSKDSITLEPYQPLQLDISSDPITTKSVTDALKHLSIPEIVQTWSNTKKENVDATKTVYVETWPGVLICHLKRFVYDSEERQVVKKSRAVAYGTELIVPNEIISPTKRSSVPVKYRLFGVVYHHGSTASGGHYTVAVSRQDHQQWIHFDDETVQPVPTDQVVVSPEEAESGRAGLIGGREKCAYLLFYQRIRA